MGGIFLEGFDVGVELSGGLVSVRVMLDLNPAVWETTAATGDE